MNAHMAEAPIVNAIPVKPISSQLLRPDATALKATTNLFIFLPPRKNSFKPCDEKRALKIPIKRINKMYPIKEMRVYTFPDIPNSIPVSKKHLFFTY